MPGKTFLLGFPARVGCDRKPFRLPKHKHQCGKPELSGFEVSGFRMVTGSSYWGLATCPSVKKATKNLLPGCCLSILSMASSTFSKFVPPPTGIKFNMFQTIDSEKVENEETVQPTKRQKELLPAWMPWIVLDIVANDCPLRSLSVTSLLNTRSRIEPQLMVESCKAFWKNVCSADFAWPIRAPPMLPLLSRTKMQFTGWESCSSVSGTSFWICKVQTIL